jgi:phosphatidylinositol-3-phosphatase
MQQNTLKAVTAIALSLLCVALPTQSVYPAQADAQNCDALPTAAVPHAAGSRPKHIFIIVMENQTYDVTFAAGSKASFLSKCLARKGLLLTNYYGIGHNSLDNYIAMVSGQSPNPDTQADCPVFSEFSLSKPGLDDYGQAVGHGCVYRTDVITIANQLEEKGLKWRGYIEGMKSACQHPNPNEYDPCQRGKDGCNQYATKHNPFVYFHSIKPEDCSANDVPLDQLKPDLDNVETTPNLSFIIPNLCNDGHDHDSTTGKCADGKTDGGLVAIDAFLLNEVPMIMNSKAYQQDGMLIVTFDEAETVGDYADAHSCCNETAEPNTRFPGLFGDGGGKIGAVIISAFVKPSIPGSPNTHPYNHYSLLRSLETLFGLSHLGYAEKPNPGEFGTDVFGQ